MGFLQTVKGGIMQARPYCNFKDEEIGATINYVYSGIQPVKKEIKCGT